MVELKGWRTWAGGWRYTHEKGIGGSITMPPGGGYAVRVWRDNDVRPDEANRALWGELAPAVHWVEQQCGVLLIRRALLESA